MVRTKRITSGGWRTVETFWNAAGTAFFKAPAGAQIKVRYGGGWFGFDRQKQILNGNDYKKLTVGIRADGLGSVGQQWCAREEWNK